MMCNEIEIKIANKHRSHGPLNTGFGKDAKEGYEVRLWRYAERWGRWRSAGLSGLVSLKGGLKRVVIRKLKALSIVEYPIPKYDAETGTCRPQMLCPKLMSSAVAW